MKNKKTLKYFIPVIIAATLILIVSISLLFITKKYELKNNVKEQDEQMIRIEEQEATNIPRMNFWGNVLDLKTKQESEYINIEYTINNEKIFESYATIKLQGTSSLNYTKKSCSILTTAFLVHQKGLEPPTVRFVAEYSIQLSY